MAVTLNTPPSPQPNPRRHRMTRAEYHLLGESGLLGDGQRYELIDGDIIEQMPQKQPHPGLVHRLLLILMAVFGGEFVGCQMPVVLSDDSEPEPDLFVTTQPGDRYLAAGDNPPGRDLRLVVEVAVTTRDFDLTTKAIRYAKGGIPEYWVLDVETRTLVVHRDPAPEGYRTVILLDEAQSVSPLAAPQASLRIADFLP